MELTDEHQKDIIDSHKPGALFHRYVFPINIKRHDYCEAGNLGALCQLMMEQGIVHGNQREKIFGVEVVFSDDGEEGYVTYRVENKIEMDKLVKILEVVDAK